MGRLGLLLRVIAGVRLTVPVVGVAVVIRAVVVGVVSRWLGDTRFGIVTLRVI